MRVNSITNTIKQYRNDYKQSQTLQVSQIPDKNLAYTTNKIEPSFGINLFGLGKKAASNIADVAAAAIPKTVETEENLAKQVIKRLKKMNPNKPTSYYYDNENSKINDLALSVDEQTAPFVSKLVDRITDYGAKNNFLHVIGQVNDLAIQYKKMPQARITMDKAINQTIKGEIRYGLYELDELFQPGCASDYNGSNLQNRILEKIMDAKDLNGSFRFKNFSTFQLFDNFTEETEEIFDLLMRKIVKGPDEISYKKLAQIIKDPTPEDIANKGQNAMIKGKRHYLIQNDYDIKNILKTITPENMPFIKSALMELLSRATKASEIESILGNYTPEKHDFLQKGLALVDKGVLSLTDLGYSMAFA